MLFKKRIQNKKKSCWSLKPARALNGATVSFKELLTFNPRKSNSSMHE